MSKRALHGMYARKAGGKKTGSRVGRLCRRKRRAFEKKQPKTLVSCAKQAVGHKMYRRNGLDKWVRSLRYARNTLRKEGKIPEKQRGRCLYPKKGNPNTGSKHEKAQKLLYATAIKMHKIKDGGRALARDIEAGTALKGPKGKKFI